MADYAPARGQGPPRAGTYGGASHGQREAAFSDIFGAAPSGRAQTMTGQEGHYLPQERSSTMTSQSSYYSTPQQVPQRQMPNRQPPNGHGTLQRDGYPPQQRMMNGAPPHQPPAQYLPQPLNGARRPFPQPQRVDPRDPRQGPPQPYGRAGPLPNRGPGPGPALNSDQFRSRSMAGMPPSGYGLPPSSYSQGPASGFRQQPYYQHPPSRTTAQGRIVPERHDERAMSMTSYSAERDHHSQTMSGRIIPNRRRESETPPSQGDQSDNCSQAPTLYSNPSQRSSSQPGVGGHRTMSMASTISVTPTERANSLVHPSLASRVNGSSSQNNTPQKTRPPMIYSALLSRVASSFLENCEARERLKNGLAYQNAFSGKEAVDLISFIIRTTDRNLALLLGRALDAQKLFHDVTYEHRLRDSTAEIYQFDETSLEDPSSKVNGVFTLLTECYSPTCTRDNLCYSIACPRRLEQQQRLNLKPQPGLARQMSTESLHADDNEEQKLWINTVSKEIADSIDDREKKRQEVISELMYTERDFVKDMEYLRDFWIKPLRAQGHGQIIPEARREMFIRTVFGNVMEVHHVNHGLANALTKRQQESPVVHHIGDVFQQFVPRFDPFIRYGANQLYGKWEFETEKARNPLFSKFVDEVERAKESRKLELNGYLTKPTTRLARYPLLLEGILKATAEGNPDREVLPQVIAKIREILTAVNRESGKSENHFNLMQLDQNLRWDVTTQVDLKLQEEGRQLIFKTGLKKNPTDTSEIIVYVFDHAILMVKPKTDKKSDVLRVYRRPIALELLQIAQMDEVIKRPSSSLTLNPLSGRSTQNTQGGKEGFPITFKNLGKPQYEITLYAANYTMRQKLMQHIETEQSKMRNRSQPYTKSILCGNFFSQMNKINCMVPTDGGRRLVYGTDNGIYVSDRKPRTNESQPRKVMDLRNVTQLDVLEEYQLLLVLADKSLSSFSLDVLQPGDVSPMLKKPRKIQNHANFFRAGVCVGRHLVCSAKASGLSTTIKVFEPMDATAKRSKGFLASTFGGSSDSLKPFKEFYIPTESSSIHFLKSKLCVACTRGFEIVSLETLETQSLLDQADTSLDFVARESRDIKPIHIERLNGEFLLNYSDFSFFVNRNGWRARHEWRIDWEGKPESFALSYPHIIAFEPNFIEIRHVETAVCEHILTAKNIRMLHSSTREIIYAYEDENGQDIVASLDFWTKAQQQNGGGTSDNLADGPARR